ncbi:MAG: VOC family protein [Myxococcales bacterium]|nr:VOC family protein [Myxococcales bacterium]
MAAPASPRLALVILAVADLPRAVAFWSEAFGLRPTVQTPVYVELALEGGPRLGLYDRRGFGRNLGVEPAAPSPTAPQPTELYFHCDDLDQAIAQVQQAGGVLLSARALRDWGDEAAYFRDPDGNVVVVARPAP